MEVLIWTSDYKPNQEMSIVPVGILVHKSIGTVVAAHQATYSKTRGQVAQCLQILKLGKLMVRTEIADNMNFSPKAPQAGGLRDHRKQYQLFVFFVIKSIIWNVKGITSQGAFDILTSQKKMKHCF